MKPIPELGMKERPPLCERLARARKAAFPKITQVEMAKRLGIAQDTYKQYETRTPIPRKYAAQVSEILNLPVTTFLIEQIMVPPVESDENSPTLTNVRHSNAKVPEYTLMNKDLPIWFTAEAGEGAFVMNTGEAVDWVRRPAGLLDNKKAYAIYVEGTSMEPVYDAGDLLYVDPNRKPKVGRDCVVHLRAKKEGDEPRFLLKRLVKRTPTQWIFKQFNPEREIKIDERQVESVHLVLKNHEINV